MDNYTYRMTEEGYKDFASWALKQNWFHLETERFTGIPETEIWLSPAGIQCKLRVIRRKNGQEK